MSDADILDFIKDNFDKEYMDVFIKLEIGVMKADMFRYLALLKNGGVYADIDTICLSPIKEWVPEDKNFVVAPEHEMNFCQWTFASSEENKYIISIVELMMDRLISIDYNIKNFVHYYTGPAMFTHAINKTIGRERNVFCFQKTNEFCSDLVSLSQCGHGDLTYSNMDKYSSDHPDFLSYDTNRWRIFRNGSVKHVFGSQTWTNEYNSWIKDEVVKNAGR